MDTTRFKGYQDSTAKTAIYPAPGKLNGLIYCVLGLNSEAGEVSGKVKKIIRDKNGEFSETDINSLKQELGDCQWYVSQIATELGLSLEDIAKTNLDKLNSRLERGKLGGDGDTR